MSIQPMEVVDFHVEADDKPPVAHCYCPECNRGKEIAVSICGHGRKPWSALRLNWPADTQHCVICEAMEHKACPRCGQ